MTSEEIGIRFREILAEKGITGYRLINEEKLSKSTVYKLMKGKMNPTLHMLGKICNALGVTFAYFVEPNNVNKNDLTKRQLEYLEVIDGMDSSQISLLMAYAQGIKEMKKRGEK